MTKTRIVLCALLLAVVSVGFALPAGGEHPPHQARLTAASGSLPLAAVGADHPGEVVAQVEFYEGVQRAEWFAGVEAQAVADLAGRSPVRSGGGFVGGGDCAALAAQLGLPEAVLWRESRCSWDAYNATGCSGRGCLGPAQVDRGHFAEVSPWNSNAAGSCAGLDPDDPAQYAECVSRLPASAWGS